MKLFDRRLQIFKVQRPLSFTPGCERQIYAYNWDKSVVFQGEVDKETLGKLFRDDEYKVFRFGFAGKGGVLKLEGEAPWQSW